MRRKGLTKFREGSILTDHMPDNDIIRALFSRPEKGAGAREV